MSTFLFPNLPFKYSKALRDAVPLLNTLLAIELIERRRREAKCITGLRCGAEMVAGPLRCLAKEERAELVAKSADNPYPPYPPAEIGTPNPSLPKDKYGFALQEANALLETLLAIELIERRPREARCVTGLRCGAEIIAGSLRILAAEEKAGLPPLPPSLCPKLN